MISIPCILFFLKKNFSRYYECNIKGEQKELLCPDGLVYDEKQQNCDYPSKVVCGNRTKLRRCNDLIQIISRDNCRHYFENIIGKTLNLAQKVTFSMAEQNSPRANEICPKLL